MKRLIYTLTLFICILSSTTGRALSLGEIRINSSLNQALQASITVKNTMGLETKEIIASIANKKRFKSAGVEYLHFYRQLKFKIREINDNEVSIEIRSHDSVIEPFLNFIIEVQTPTGRSFKQYTLLVEPL
ncbi:MAG: hypothetical protein KUG76_02955 [Gammaproteobacteria bacterium]|nr:hypothetical protein [Gammaproteobacteria bacterium]